MKPNVAHPCSPIAMLRSIWINRNLIFQLTKREVVGRYKGSLFGLAWSFFNPLLMLTVFTFVFSKVFRSRWSGGSDSMTELALALFIGLIMFNSFAECINRASGRLQYLHISDTTF
jgi:lipopolysaccharide transport system permease protein